MIRNLVIAIILALPTAGFAQEFSLQGGAAQLTGGESSYSWEFGFRRGMAKYAAWSASWLNEGHGKAHHRDGIAPQLWLGSGLKAKTLGVSVGAGGYYYNDTVLLSGGGTENVHGWAPIYSLSLMYTPALPWFLQATVNHVVKSDGLGTDTFLAGFGYRLGAKNEADAKTESPARTTGGELTYFLGKSVVNDGVSENKAATAIEYRHGIARNFDWTFSWINEGDSHILRRSGFATQLWLVEAFPAERIIIGIGVGPYLYSHRKSSSLTPLQDAYDHQFAALISPTVSYRLTKHWQARLMWNRVVSDYNRDADVFLAGVSYRWGDWW